MQSWKPDIASLPGPKYLAIADALMRDVQSGRLAPGARLPSQRNIADTIGVDLTTVTRAFAEAKRRGLIESDGRRGSFIPKQLTRLATPARADVGDAGMNAPPDMPDGLLVAEWRKSVQHLLGPGTSAALQYQPRGGMPAARETGAQFLARREIPCSADSLVVTAGGQQALHAIFSAALRTGDILAVGYHVYPGLLALARRFGISLHPLPCDADGIDPDALDAACSRSAITALYVVPANDNPTTVTTPTERRKAIAQIARRRGLTIIEDDAYGLLCETPLTPIAAMAPELTWHVASTSKILSPGLRVAWLRAPDVAQAWKLAADVHETAIMAPPLNVAIVCDWISRSPFDRIVAEVRSEGRARQSIVAGHLPEASYNAQPEGYHLWVPLPRGVHSAPIIEAMRPFSISVIGEEAFASDPAKLQPAVRVSIGGTLSRSQLERAMRLFSALVTPGTMTKLPLV